MPIIKNKLERKNRLLAEAEACAIQAIRTATKQVTLCTHATEAALNALASANDALTHISNSLHGAHEHDAQLALLSVKVLASKTNETLTHISANKVFAVFAHHDANKLHIMLDDICETKHEPAI